MRSIDCSCAGGSCDRMRRMFRMFGGSCDRMRRMLLDSAISAARRCRLLASAVSAIGAGSGTLAWASTSTGSLGRHGPPRSASAAASRCSSSSRSFCSAVSLALAASASCRAGRFSSDYAQHVRLVRCVSAHLEFCDKFCFGLRQPAHQVVSLVLQQPRRRRHGLRILEVEASACAF